MVNFLPAVLVGGPPNAGKSVLFYRLTQALRECGVTHYPLRACPDGEGNWYHEGEEKLVEELRKEIKLKLKEWPPAFIQLTTQALEYRNVPLLVDMGGHPKASQGCLLHGCTHSILLVREDKPDDARLWQDLIETHNLIPLARIISRREGESLITAESPVLEGIITGLERGKARKGAGAGPLFDILVERIVALFTSYDLQEIKESNLKRAPTELVLDVEQELRTVTTSSIDWEPSMLLPFLERVPQQSPLSVEGRGPGWLYAALAAYGDQQPFYLFDTRLPFVWVQPVAVALDKDFQQREDLAIKLMQTQEAAVLKIRFPQVRLEYLQPDPLVFPPVSSEQGIVFDGPLPYWLLTALTRLYKSAGMAWIATYYPPLGKAVVVYSRTEQYRPGDLVEKPLM
ncbi:MAG TPA: CRISPR-associated protein Csx3 [Ktedonobacteraceae bacterium]|nr:CRISPR-associated protein Csx3 [Ktedonobacteraceae bacterium]